MKKTCIKKLSVLLLIFSVYSPAQPPNIIINEFLTSNAHINYDPDYKNYSDWFEIYNNENSPVNLKGYYLTDDLTNPMKRIIGNDIIIEPDGYFVFWADDNGQTMFHTNFKLNKDGDQIGIYMPDGSIVDTVSYHSQQTDISSGRNPDNRTEWLYYYNPTPGYVNNTIGYSEIINCSPPIFSEMSGFYNTDISLEMTADINADIRYTLDGSEPNENSEKYTYPISISDRTDEPNYFSEIPTNINPFSWLQPWAPPVGQVRKATILRAKTFAQGKIPSNTVTHTYFIGSLGLEIQSAFKPIPVISLVSDEKHLFSDSAGIYVPGISYTGEQLTGNYMQDWNKPAHFQFFDESGNLKISQELDIRIQGSTAQINPQKGLHLIARGKYGKNSIDYPFYMDRESKANEITSFKRIILRAWGSPGWNSAMLYDVLAQTSYAKSSLDIQDYRPTIVFINGEYWGLHEIREANKNPYYFEGHYGIDRNDPGIDLIVGGSSIYHIDEGDDIHWKNMLAFIDNNDMSITQNYEYVKTQMDVDNFIDYIGHCVYFGKKDWPLTNQAMWRPRTLDGRWKWIQYDMDACLAGPTYNMMDHVSLGIAERPPHLLLLELLKNQHFKFKFINWFSDRIYSDFLPEIIHNRHGVMLNELYPFLGEHQDRWARIKSNFHTSNVYIANFISKRPGNMQTHLQTHFNLGNMNTFMLGNINNDGNVKINSLLVDKNTPGYIANNKEWIGKYYEDIPITVIAKPKEGFVFDHWFGAIESNSDSITIYVDKNMWIGAEFSPIEKIDSLYINEILADNQSFNTDSAGDYDDWIELYNAGSNALNLEGLYFTDDFSNSTKWKFPSSDSISYSIAPKQFQLIWCDNEQEEGQDHLGFSLSKTGEMIGITQITGSDTVFIDSLSFSEQLPNISYGRFPDGSDQFKFMVMPTPGSKNIFHKDTTTYYEKPQLFQNYPNPFNESTSIPFYLSDTGDISIEIYNVEGKLVKSLIKKQAKVGYDEFLWNGRDKNGNALSSGVYFYRMQIDGFNQVKKMLFLK